MAGPLFVVPRYGRDIVGGAETLVRGLVTRALGPDIPATVATTCAVDHATWEDVLPPGETREDGARVLRFPVAARDGRLHAALHQRLQAEGRLSYLNELELMGAGVWSPGLQRHLEEHGAEHSHIIFAPYLFGTTFWGVQAHPERSVLLPCLHDEPDAHMECLREPFGAVAGWIFNTAAEERLARRLFRVRRSAVVGAGLDTPDAPAADDFARRNGLGRYLLYAGRLERGKRVDVAVEYTARLIAERGLDLTLVLIGSGSYRAPRRLRDHIVELGYVSEAEKRAAYAGALALVNPSELESLSLVLLEAWREGTPAIVAGGSEVMAEHCARSGGGFTFSDYPEFSAAVAGLFGDAALRRRMGEAGREYVRTEYAWDAVSARLRRFLQPAG
jgi:glycosyltransferase involved in cell wall biosynthesis